MSQHPKNLEETALWKIYMKKTPEIDSSRRIWVKKIYYNATTYLKRVCVTFPNYTLHDETHVLNVIYAMGAVLGDQIENLSVGEIELLILVAALHDIGMVYDEEDKENAFNDKRKCKRFLQENSPELIGVPYTDWSDNTKQWYLRTLHPFRLHEILSTGEWKNLCDERPREIVPLQNIIAVCQAHGEEFSSIKSNEMLKYLPAYETDALFSAMLLRLADLLDFDDTRSPQILFKYAANNEKSIKEWRKHMASTGFKYPPTPSGDNLVFSAECNEPGEEYSIRDFLDWIDDELNNCKKLQRLCYKKWQQEFPFPYSISKDSIISVGYVSDKFMLTMDQTRILELLTGENLYDNYDVFIRELLQNAVDATLLRGKLDKNFKVENARIDLWEWNDNDGYIWFRIDDQGTGMTLGVLKNYFLKVGNSYYISKELKRDLSNYSDDSNFYSISRFGIGFLSCFLCGIEAEISTLYFDDNKSKGEHAYDIGDRNGYGLRMQITGLSGYYTLRSQADNHVINSSLPTPVFIDSVNRPKLEYNGYRSESGTSIVIKLDPKKLNAINLKSSAEEYTCGTYMPVFYNGERIGHTYSEIMEKAHKISGETIYAFSDREKEKYDKLFPNAKGQYPKIVVTVESFNMDGHKIISNLSGILVRYNVLFDHSPQWKVMDQTYTISASLSIHNTTKSLSLSTENTKETSEYDSSSLRELLETYGKEKVDALKKTLSQFIACPVSSEELGETWSPFAKKEDISKIWRIFVDESQSADMSIELDNRLETTFKKLTNRQLSTGLMCAYHGIFVGNLSEDATNINATFFFEKELQPIVNIARTKVTTLPLEAHLAIIGIMQHLDHGRSIMFTRELSKRIGSITLFEWRHIYNAELGKWILETQKKLILQIQKFLQTPFKDDQLTLEINEAEFFIRFAPIANECLKIIYKFISAYFQDTYDMSICYEDGQSIVFIEKKKNEYNYYFDKFPPMMFCKARSDKSRRYLCSIYSHFRKGITLDHPFAKWLIENAIKIENHFPHGFKEIVNSLCDDTAQEIIKTANKLYQQITESNIQHGINVTSLYNLTDEDFWDY